MGQTLQDGAFAHKAYQADVFISHKHIGTLVSCRRNSLRMLVKYALTLPWQPYRHASTKNGQAFFQDKRDSLPENTQDSSLRTEKDVYVDEPGDILQMLGFTQTVSILSIGVNDLQFTQQSIQKSVLFGQLNSLQALTLKILMKGNRSSIIKWCWNSYWERFRSSPFYLAAHQTLGTRNVMYCAAVECQSFGLILPSENH